MLNSKGEIGDQPPSSTDPSDGIQMVISPSLCGIVQLHTNSIKLLSGKASDQGYEFIMCTFNFPMGHDDNGRPTFLEEESLNMRMEEPHSRSVIFNSRENIEWHSVYGLINIDWQSLSNERKANGEYARIKQNVEYLCHLGLAGAVFDFTCIYETQQLDIVTNLSCKLNDLINDQQYLQIIILLPLLSKMTSVRGGLKRNVRQFSIQTHQDYGIHEDWYDISEYQRDDALKLLKKSCFSFEHPSNYHENELPTESFLLWQRVTSATNFSSRIQPAVIFPEVVRVEDEILVRQEIKKWEGFKLAFIIISTGSFIANKMKFPVLPKIQQFLMKKILRLNKCNLPVFIHGPIGHEKHNMERDIQFRLYFEYIKHMYKNAMEIDEKTSNNQAISTALHGCEDELQLPLQPLKFNLTRYTYDLFERDPIKYRQYELAIFNAMLFLTTKKGRDQPFLVIMLGAGRGPIVDKIIEAGRTAKIASLKIIAVEKNRYAIPVLTHQLYKSWNVEENKELYTNKFDYLKKLENIVKVDKNHNESDTEVVIVVNEDMRTFSNNFHNLTVVNGGIKADLVVSELLGSFGDNELSPECLSDNLLKNLLHHNGFCIPQSYSSYIAPISSKFIRNKLNMLKQKDVNVTTKNGVFERPYVINLSNASILTEPVELFTFQHFVNKNNETNLEEKYKRIDFIINCKMGNDLVETSIDGFIGYFDCRLFDQIRITILPNELAKVNNGMFSCTADS
ncbi:hypothetical protein SNEBB_007305 [Seison nebaliae]|nr:hypothetical protein SNEBB_007305 [Seison nebaliae]